MDYLKQKLPPQDPDKLVQDAVDKEIQYKKDLMELRGSKPQMVEDFQKTITKDLPVEKINTRAVQPITSGSDFQANIEAKRQARKNALASIGKGITEEKVLPATDWKKEFIQKNKGGALRAIGPIGAAAQVVPALADLKEGNSNTAAARLVTGLAPAGTDQLSSKLMDQAALADSSPELMDENYLKTLRAIGERRQREGKSPIVESFSGKQIDTSATEDSDFLNKIKAAMRANSQG